MDDNRIIELFFARDEGAVRGGVRRRDAGGRAHTRRDPSRRGAARGQSGPGDRPACPL